MKKIFTLLFLMALVCVKGWGQTTVTQGFENTGSLPTGWAVSSSSYLSVVGAGTNPTQTPHGGSYQIRWNSYSASSGTTANLYSPSFDLSARGSNTPTVTLWFYRDVSAYNSSTYATEGVNVIINTTASSTGGTTLGFVPRNGVTSASGTNLTTTTNLTTGTSGWYSYTFSLPSSYNTSTNYLVFKFTSAFGNNCFMDDVSYVTYPTICTPPTTQASIGTYTNNTTGNSLTVNWTRGNGSSVLVVARPTATTNVAPTTGTIYNASASYGSGSTTGAGNYVVYSGIGTSVNVTGLSPNTGYTFTVYEYNGTSCYTTSGSSSAVTTLAACTNTTAYPTASFAAPAAGVTYQITTAQFQQEYNTMIGAAAGTSFTSTAGLSNTYITIRSGTYNGAVVASGATPLTWTAPTATTFYIHYNVGSSCGTASTSMTTTVTNNTPLPVCTTPSAPTAVALGSSTTTTQAGTITAPGTVPTGYLVIASTSPTLSSGPVDGTTYSTSSTIGGGSVKYVGTSTSFSASALTSNTQYYYFVYSYNSGCTGAPYYSTTAATANKYTCISAPTGLTYSSVTSNSASVSWTASSGTITSYDLKYGTTSGTYSNTVTGVTSPVSLTGLSAGTTYYYVIVANNTANTSSCGTSTTSAQSSFTTPLANDLCSGATILSLNSAKSTTIVGATYTTLGNDTYAPVSGTTGYSYSANGDVWYSFIACNTGTATVATNSSISQDLDLFAYNSNCPTDNNTNVASGTISNTSTETMSVNVIAGQIYYIRVAKYSGTSGAFTITVTAGAAAPSISAASLAAQALCINTPANTLSVTASNATSYQWYSNATASNSGGSPVSGATASTYTPSTTTAGTTYYYVVISNNCASTTSAVSGAIKVNPAPTAALSGTPTTCAGDATNITVTLTGTQPWTIVYNDGTDHTVANITASPYSLSVAPTSNTTYSLVSVNDVNACAGGTVSGTATVTVNPATTITQQPTPNDQEICQNSTGATLSVAATGTGTMTYQWFRTTQNNNTSGSSVGAANGGQTSTYTIPTTASGNSYYYVKITSSVCGTITSNVSGRITVSSTVIGAGPAPASQTICQNTAAAAISVSSVSGIDIDYTWYSNATNSNVGGTPVPGGPNSRSFTPTAASTSTAGTTYYYVVVDGQCGSAVSNVATVIVTPATSITNQPSATPQAACLNSNATTPLTVTAIGTNVSYQWYSNSTPSTSGGTAVGTNNSSYTPPTSAIGTTYYYVVVTGSCVPTSVVSQVSGPITINPLPTASISGTTVVCQNAPAQQITFTGANGTAPYTFSYTIGGDNTTRTVTSSGNTATVAVPTATAGTFTYTLQSVKDASSTACTNTASGNATVTVTANPVASIVTPASSACEGGAVGVTFSGTPNASIEYTLDGVAQPAVHINANGDNVTINSPSNVGTYQFVITSVTLGSCSGTAGSSTTVTIHPLPTVSPIAGNNYVAIGRDLNLANATAGGVWTINSTDASLASQTSNPATAVVHGESAGTPTVSYTTAANEWGCTNTASLVVNVYNPALARFRTVADGYATNPAVWEVFTGVPDNWEPATAAPTNNSNIEVRHNLSLLYADFKGSANSSFIITGHTDNGNTIPGTLTIAPTHFFQSQGAVNFNNNLVVLQSDATGTAAIGEMPNGSIANATNVQVERYIGVNTTATHPGRAWRLLTAPVSGTTINAAWQEGQLWNGTGGAPPSTGRGTLITGYIQNNAANANSNGYDFWDAIYHSNSSIRAYVPGSITGTWQSMNSIAARDISDKPAYMLFVRGDRSVTTGSGATTLRATGMLKQGVQTTTVPLENAYTLVGNPYASLIDFDKVYTANASVIQNKFLMWNANNGTYGAYTLVDGSGGSGYYTTIPFPLGTTLPNDNARYIPSGAGFFVYPNGGGDLVINESAKSPEMTALVNPFRENAYLDKKLYVNLNLKDGDTSALLADGLLARFDAAYSAAVDGDDVSKQANFNENLGIQSAAKDLMVEARPNIVKTDTLQLKLWNVTKRSYQLQMKTERFDSLSTLHAWLEDRYLNTKEEISLSGAVSTFNFTVTSDSLSWKADRFRIVFQNQSAVLPVTLTSVTAAPQNSGVNVSWTVTNEVNMKGYTVEKSVDGGRTGIVMAEQTAKNATGAALTTYNSFDATPQKGDNLYRIRMTGKDGSTSYSQWVKVTIEESKGGVEITLYPNPVREGKAWLQLSNLEKGGYRVSVYSAAGQSVYEKKIVVANSAAGQSEELKLGKALAGGSYNLILTDSKGKTIYQTKLIVAQ